MAVQSLLPQELQARVGWMVVNAQTEDDKWLAANNMILLDDQSGDGDRLPRLARDLILTLPDRFKDDRYLEETLPVGSRAAALIDRSENTIPLAFASASTDGQRLQLDVVTNASVPSTVEQTAARLQLLVRHLSGQAGHETITEIWTRPDDGPIAAGVEALGFRRVRSLHQLRLALPASASPIATRDFDPARDLAQVVEINNKAFAQHPDQGGQTEESFASLMAEPWFDPAGLRVLDDPNGSDTLAGFCWTKIHPAGNYRPTSAPDDAQPTSQLGEIYVIGLNPAHHGQGLGVPLVASGLQWLSSRGVQEVLLYVESDNAPAMRTYQRLGFTINRTDSAWHRASAVEHQTTPIESAT